MDTTDIINEIEVLRRLNRGAAIALYPDQRDAFKQALLGSGSGEIVGPPPAVPSEYTGSVVLLSGFKHMVADAEVLGIFGGTTIVRYAADNDS